MNLCILAILFSIILPLQSLTVNTASAVSDTILANQYGMTQTVTYPRVDLQWAPTKPTAGQDVTFTITFTNPGSSMPKSHIDYTFKILKDGNTVYSVSKHTHSGTDTIKQKLAAGGVHKITVTITGIDFNAVSPRSSDFSVTVEKPQMQEETKQQAPPIQPKETPSTTEEPKKMVKEEQKKSKVLLVDENGKRVAIAKIVQKGTKSFIVVAVKPQGINDQISAWLVAGSNEDTGANKWMQMMDMFVMPIGHSAPAKHTNMFRQSLAFVPTSGDMIVIAIDDCSSGECKPTMNHMARGMLK